MAKFSDDTAEKVKNYIQESFKWAQEWRERNIDNEMIKSMRLYMSQIDEDEGMWKWLRNRLFIPKTNSIIEAILPKMFGFEPTFSLVPKESTDESTTRIMESVLKYYLLQMNYPLRLMLWARNNAIYGWNTVKAVWKTDIRSVRRPLTSEEINAYISMDEEPPSMIDYPMTMYDGPDFVIVDPFDYYWPPSVSELDEMPFQIHRTAKNYEYLKDRERKGIYQNINEIQKIGIRKRNKMERSY